MTKHREDITALRAIAILAVLIFHIFPTLLPGGYLGVDVFFVISGYVIGSLLLKELANTGSLSLTNFYRRRILRIMPAVLVVLFISLSVGLLIMDFPDLVRFSKSALYSLFGGGNLYFYLFQDNSYFAPDSALFPLLHFWSLGVEEQFYLFLPLFFLLFFRKKKRLSLLLILFFLSLIFSNILVKHDRMQAYYMLYTRAFELLAGVLAAYFSQFKISQKYYSITSLVFLSLMLCSFVFLSSNYLTPGYLTLIPILPTATLLFIGHNQKESFIYKILTNKIFHYIGLWSFSIYLIHWPLLVFAKYINGVMLDGTFIGTNRELLLIFCLSIILGAISYYLVEQKFRYKKYPLKKSILLFLLLPFVLLWAISSHSQYLDKKYAPMRENLALSSCFATTKQTSIFDRNCIINKQNGEPNIILWGDSYAAQQQPLIELIAKKLNFSFRTLERSGCNALTNLREPLLNNRKCSDFINKSYSLIKQYDIIILGARWMQGDTPFVEKILSKLSKITKLLLVIGNIPRLDNFNMRQIISPSIFGLNFNKNFLSGFWNQYNISTNKEIRNITSIFPNTKYIDFYDISCDKTQCQYQHKDRSLYSNIYHWSTFGSEYFGEQYIKKGIDPVFYKIKSLYKITGPVRKDW